MTFKQIALATTLLSAPLLTTSNQAKAISMISPHVTIMPHMASIPHTATVTPHIESMPHTITEPGTTSSTTSSHTTESETSATPEKTPTDTPESGVKTKKNDSSNPSTRPVFPTTTHIGTTAHTHPSDEKECDENMHINTDTGECINDDKETEK